MLLSISIDFLTGLCADVYDLNLIECLRGVCPSAQLAMFHSTVFTTKESAHIYAHTDSKVPLHTAFFDNVRSSNIDL